MLLLYYDIVHMEMCITLYFILLPGVVQLARFVTKWEEHLLVGLGKAPHLQIAECPIWCRCRTRKSNEP